MLKMLTAPFRAAFEVVDYTRDKKVSQAIASVAGKPNTKVGGRGAG